MQFSIKFDDKYARGLENLEFGSFDRKARNALFKVDDNGNITTFHESILGEITKSMMNGVLGRVRSFTCYLANALNSDLCAFVRKYLDSAIDIRSVDNSLKNEEIKKLGIPDIIASEITRPKAQGIPATTDYCGSLEPLLKTALIFLNIAQSKGHKIDYLKDFANLENCLHNQRVEEEMALSMDLGQNQHPGSYSAVINSPVDIKAFRDKEDLVRRAFEKIKFEIGLQPGGYATGRIYPIGFEDDGTYEPLVIRDRTNYNPPSDNAIKDNSVMATPVEGIIRLENWNSSFPTALNDDDRYRKTGPILQYEAFRMSICIAFKLHHDTKNNRRLIPNANKQYKLYTVDSIPADIDLIRTLAENPGSMIFDRRKIGGNTVSVLRPAEVKKDFTSDKEIKQYIKEVIREEFGSNIKSDDMFKAFLQLADTFDAKYENGKDIPNITSNYISGFDGRGLDRITFDWSKYAPDSYLRILENLKDIEATFTWFAKQAKALNDYISERAKNIDYSVDKKITYRDFIAELILSEAKLDPLALSASKYQWIQNIAKAIF